MQNNIFIWVSWGDIEVYLIDNSEKLANLYDTITHVMSEMLLDADIIAKVDAFIDKKQYSTTAYIKAIEYLLEQICVGSHESFEFGTGFGKLK